MATDIQTTLGDCPTHGEVEATRRIPRVTFPPIITAVQRAFAKGRLLRIPLLWPPWPAASVAGRGPAARLCPCAPGMAVTYAVSVSLPLAGPHIGAAFSFRQFGRRGVDSAVVAWALAMSGVISSLAFAIVLGAGARLSHRDASLS